MSGRRSCSMISICSIGFCFSLLVSSVAGQTWSGSPASASTEVVYLTASTSLWTYHVDRNTGVPTQQGPPVILDASGPLQPSPNDRFIYVYSYTTEYVYATDSRGVPQLPAVQALSLADGSFGTGYLEIHPNGTLAYATELMRDVEGNFIAKLSKFTIDPTTGMMAKSPRAVATFKPNGPCGPGTLAEVYGPNLWGFNPAGTVMYESWYCGYYSGSIRQFFYSRTVNQETGAIGPEKFLFSYSDDFALVGGTDVVNFTPVSIIYFKIPYTNNAGLNSVNVYPVTGGTRLFSGTKTMLEACGYGLWNTPDVTGKFDVIELSPDKSQITKIEYGAKKIVDTGYDVDGTVRAFAPDDALVYTETNHPPLNPPVYVIYMFDNKTGAVKTGGQITIGYVADQVVPVLRE